MGRIDPDMGALDRAGDDAGGEHPRDRGAAELVDDDRPGGSELEVECLGEPRALAHRRRDQEPVAR